MKKFVCYLLVAVMLIASLATTAFAAEVGETVDVVVSAKNNPGFIGYSVELGYDESALKLVAMKATGLTAGGFESVNLDEALFTFVKNDTNIVGDGDLFVATFEILEGAAGKYEVEATLVEAYADSTEEELLPAVEFDVVATAVEVEVPHVHVYDEGVVTKAPTCLETGVMTFTCECGDSYTEEIPVVDHAWGGWKGVDDYYHCRECSVANHTEKEAHEWDETGLKCTVCGWEKDPDLDPVPGTGDITPVVVTTAFALIAMVALAAYMLKRKFAL